MADVKDEVEELEELLVGLETEGPMEAYSEDDDAVTLSMAAPIGDQEWMVQLSPTNRKMMSTDRVVTELGLGTLSDTTLVWRGGMEEWMPIAEVEDLTRARSSVPPPRPALDPAALPLPALAPSPLVARAALAAPMAEGSEDGLTDDALDAADGDDPTPLVPPSPDEALSDGDKPAPPTRPRSYTGGPVAVDFSSMPPKRPASLRVVLGAGAAAGVMIVVTLFSLSRGGVFETTASSSEGRAVSSLEPAPSTPADPGPAGAQEPSSGPKQEAAAPAETPPAAAPSPTPAASEAAATEQPAAAVASTDAAETDGSSPTARASKTRMKPKKRARTAMPEPAATTTPEAAATTAAIEAEEVPAKRAKPAARSKTQNVAAKPAAEEPADPAEEAAAPAPGPTVGFNRQAAKNALKDAAAQAANCRPAGGPTGNGKVQVRYDATGKVGSVSILTPGFENTTTGSCIQMVFRRAKVASFSGAPVVLTESFEIK